MDTLIKILKTLSEYHAFGIATLMRNVLGERYTTEFGDLCIRLANRTGDSNVIEAVVAIIALRDAYSKEDTNELLALLGRSNRIVDVIAALELMSEEIYAF